MNYLHENNIAVTVTFSSAISKGLHPYRVRERNWHDRDDDDCRVVFVGSYYATNSERSHTFNIAEIVRNDVEVFGGYTNTTNTNVRLVTTYWVEVNTGSTWVKSSDIKVAHVYRYPNFRAQGQTYLDPGQVLLDYGSSYNNSQVAVALQGFNRFATDPNKKLALIPRYPLYEDDQYMSYSSYPFGLVLEGGNSVQSVTLNTIDDGDGDVENPMKVNTIDYFGYEYNTVAFIPYMGELMGQYQAGSLYGDTCSVWMLNDNVSYSSPFYYTKVAIFEKCYSRYYLYWQDRFGSFQSQPFSEVIDYSEDIKAEEVQNYMNVRRRSLVTVQPKWKITSGWIKESLYPYYESLYISPVLKLLDTKYDIVYDVIFKGNYVEKNYRNQKSMINLTLDLEQTNTQNILY